MTEQMTALDALNALAVVVKREGRDTVRDCHYAIDDEEGWPVPHCIVGCVLADKGVSIDVLAAMPSTTLDGLCEAGELDQIIDLAPDAVKILRTAQERQDVRMSWGKALAAARRRAWKLGVIGKKNDLRRYRWIDA